MTYATGTYTDAADLLSKLSTFAGTTITTTWTIDDAVGSDKFAMHIGTDLYVSFRYDSLATPTDGNEHIVSIHQALGHTPAAQPGDHPDDSGSGYNATSSVTNTDLDNERYIRVDRDSSTFALNTYHFFEDDTVESYIHVVISKANGFYRHFGFGSIEKFGTWTGGEYCYGSFNFGTVTPYHANHFSASLDGRAGATGSVNLLKVGHYATIHVEGFASEDATSKWGEVKNVYDTDDGTDSASNPRMQVQGGFRGGLVCNALGAFPVGKTNGFYNLIPINLFSYFETPTPSEVHYMGAMLDVRNIIMDGLTPGQEITDGADTWIVFPSYFKDSAGGASSSTLFQGLAYKKIV